MATKSAGIPSDTASSASPRYRRTFGASSTSPSSRQSRIASAISVGVISSSPASSATELTRAIARRIRSAAARPAIEPPLAVGRLARPDDHPPLRLLADARAGHVRVALQRQVDGASLEGLHRVERDRVACHLDLPSGAHRDLAHGVLAALPVTLHVDDHALTLRQVLADHHVRHRLERAQRLTTPADQAAEIPSADVEGDRLSAGSNRDLRPHAHVLQQAFDEPASDLRLAVDRCGRHAHARRVLVDDGDLDDGLFGRLAEDLDVDVATALLELDQRRVDGLIESAAPTY